MKRYTAIATLVVASLFSVNAAESTQSGQVTLNWKEDMNAYRDVRSVDTQKDKYHARIQRYFQDYFEEFAGKKLPQGYSLEVNIDELDLAGEVRHNRGHTNRPTRMMREVDIPSMTLSYTLKNDAGTVVTSGQDKLKDMRYLTRTEVRKYKTEIFKHEKVLIGDFFKDYLEPHVQG